MERSSDRCFSATLIQEVFLLKYYEPRTKPTSYMVKFSFKKIIIMKKTDTKGIRVVLFSFNKGKMYNLMNRCERQTMKKYKSIYSFFD